jgi:membrane fusion protein, heavy metal efflux system
MKMRIIFLALLVTPWFMYGCGDKETPATAVQTPAVNPDLVVLTDLQYQNAGIALGSPQTKTMGTSLELTGEVDLPPSGLINISVPYGGFLRKTTLMPGSPVRKGQVLAQLEHPDYVQLQQDYLDTQTKIQMAQLEVNRQKELNAEQISALKNLQQVRTELQLLQNNRAGLRQKLQMININPDRLTNRGISPVINLLSPINGYVKNVNGNLGQMVNASDVLFELVNTADLHIKLNVFERDITKLKVGQEFTFKLPNDTLERKAKIILVGRTVEGDKTIPVHAHLPHDDPKLIPGMFVTATIKTGNLPVTVLPETAVVQFEGQSFIFVNQENHQFKRVPVETGLKNEEMVEVKLPADLTNSNKIAVKGAHNLLAKQANAAEEE